MTVIKNATFDTIPAGTKVAWHYRSAIGHGTVKGIHKNRSNPETPCTWSHSTIITRVSQQSLSTPGRR